MKDPKVDVGLDRAALNRAFPFHFRLEPRAGSWGTVAEIGSNLGRIAPVARVGRGFEEVFTIERPTEGIDLSLGPDQSVTYLLKPRDRDDDLLVRGQFLRVGRTGSIVFIGSPWVGELDALSRYGLSLHDFPAHESLGDMLLLLQTRNVALKDLRELNHRLAATARTLDERNRQLQEELDRRQRLETRLRQIQKMEAIGLLAGGVAHDFNNLMTAILGFAALANQSLPKEHAARSHLDEIQKATDRASALTSQLLAFSRRQVVQPRIIDLSAECRDAESLLRRLLGERVRLAATYDSEPVRIEIDPNALHQVIMNLAVNARDAMPGGGTLTIRTARVDPASPESPMPGRYGVLLEVRDEGTGIPPDVLERIFEPFFTTKPTGRGTGLGLSTVYGIVQQAGGEITVESLVGRGTTFRLWFPAREPAVVATVVEPAPETRRAAARVLLVEDEPAVRLLLSRVLSSAGFTVSVAGDPASALASAREADRLDVLVTDVGLPGMNGAELASAILSVHPGARALFISGYAEDGDFRDRLQQGAHGFLQKPFRPAELVDRIVQLLVQPPAASKVPENP